MGGASPAADDIDAVEVEGGAPERTTCDDEVEVEGAPERTRCPMPSALSTSLMVFRTVRVTIRSLQSSDATR